MPFNQNLKHIQINIENDISFKIFDQSWLVTFFYQCYVYKTSRFNTLILHIKFINILFEVAFDNLLISPSHITWGLNILFCTFDPPSPWSG